MDRPKVSVIIPVYNVEEFLAEAIDSALNQTIGDVEVIAVDDGSTDGSAAVLAGYADRIKVITKKNAGQASARNDALDIATGEYVYFLDSDDWIEPDTLEVCYNLCEKDNLDFAFFDAVIFGESDDLQAWCDYERTSLYPGIRKGPDTMKAMLADGSYRCTVCMSLFRRSFIEDNHLRFYPGIIHEDELYSAMVYFHARRIEAVPRAFYHRRVRGSSTMTTNFSMRNVNGYMTVLRELSRFLRHSPEYRPAGKALISAIMQSLMDNSWNLPLKVRLKIAGLVIFKYPYSFKARSFGRLLFKKIKN